MGKHSSTVVPRFVMGDERNMSISKVMRTRLNQLISMKQMRKMNISLTIGTWLDSESWNTQVHMQEIFQNIPDVLKIELFLRQRVKASNGDIIVMLLNTACHYPHHRWASWHHHTLGSRWQKRPWINKVVSHRLRRSMNSSKKWGFFRPSNVQRSRHRLNAKNSSSKFTK